MPKNRYLNGLKPRQSSDPMRPITALIILLFAINIAYPQVNLSQGLVAYYPFNGNANDVSGNGNNGNPLNGVQLTTDRFGNANNAYLFDGVDDYIQIPNSASLNPTNAMSIALYFNPTQHGVQSLIGKIGYSAGIATQFQVAMDFALYPGILFGVNPINNGCAGIPLNSAYVNTGGSIALNQWHCFVGTFENGVMKIYLDGVLIQTSNAGFNTLNQCPNADIQIGSWWAGDLQRYKGKIDDIRIYNRALNQQEVSALCLQVNPVANFSAPDTVCFGTPVNITNQSVGASSYFWNFCVGDLNTPPQGVNFGNIGGAFRGIVYMDYVFDNATNSWYGFITDNHVQNLYRLDFGNSLLNTPTLVNLGNPSGVFPTSLEGLQVVQNEGNWYAIIVGGDPSNGSTPSIVKIDFGPNITNTSPVGTNWGNIGNLSYPHDLYLFNDNGIWYGLTANFNNSTVTKFNFTNSFTNIPTATNLGNIGNLNGPTGLYALNDNGNWYAFVTNALSSTITRLDFGSSLLNTPTGTNIGNPGGLFHTVWDISLIKFCGNTLAYAINADGAYKNVLRLDFHGSLTNTPSVTDLGNIGNLSFPHCISKIFRDGSDLYTFIPNVDNSTLSRLRFPGCNNASIPNSNAFNPPPINYNAPGTYNIVLTIDDGLPTQSSFCREVVVMPPPPHKPLQSLSICEGDSLKIGTGIKSTIYAWNTNATTDSIYIKITGNYWVTLNNAGWCTDNDSFALVEKAKPVNNIASIYLACQDSIVLYAGNAGASYLWQDGSTIDSFSVHKSGKYYVTITGSNGCKSSDTANVIIEPIPVDFMYHQDACNPLSVQFLDGVTNTTNPWWDLGDGTFITGNTSPNHIYSTLGNYTVRFALQNGTCVDTVTKTVSVSVLNSDIIITPDTTICTGNVKQLRGVTSSNFCWSPTTYLDNPNINNPTTSTPKKITYYYTAEVAGNNLVVNGDFSAGNTGFTSQHLYSTSNSPDGSSAGQYYVGNSPGNWNPDFSTCVDHTNGSSNMMLVRGTEFTDLKVWQETIPVTKNTNYTFSYWTTMLISAENPDLQVYINGKPVGVVFVPIADDCLWQQFSMNWSSGDSTVARISIGNLRGSNSTAFALDDISFTPVFIKRDSVIISIDSPVVKTNNDTTMCNGNAVQLIASGGATYNWSPPNGLSNNNTSNPVAQPSSSTQYIVTGTTIYGCSAKDTVNININPKPTVSASNDTLICAGTTVQLFASGGVLYSWSPNGTLSNSNIFNPVASPNSNTTYIVTVTDANTCSNSDSVKVNIKPPPVFSASADQAICTGSSIKLIASGGDNYLWNPAASLDDPNIANPVATPGATTQYSVLITENLCHYDTTIALTITVNPTPTIVASKSNDIDCSVPTATLLASGGASYVWSPSAGVDDPFKQDPIANIDSTTTFLLKGTDVNGCYAYDSVTVNVTSKGKPIFEVPNAFTPNGDGKNDCFGIKKWGNVTIEEFSVFNRWGERVFTSRGPNGCWDGTFKGKMQDTGGFAYVIKAKSFCGEITRTGIVMLIR